MSVEYTLREVAMWTLERDRDAALQAMKRLLLTGQLDARGTLALSEAVVALETDGGVSRYRESVDPDTKNDTQTTPSSASHTKAKTRVLRVVPRHAARPLSAPHAA